MSSAFSVEDAWQEVERSRPDVVVTVARPNLDGVALLAHPRRAARRRARARRRAGRGRERAARAPDRAPRRARARGHPRAARGHPPHAAARARLERSVRELLGKIGKLPPVPSVCLRASPRASTDPSVSVFELGRIVAEDPALSAQVLKIANSAYFSHGNPVTQIAAAA